MKQSKYIYTDAKGNEWVVEKKTIPMQHWNFYWVGECYALNMVFKGNVRKYVITKIKEYEAN
jgi:hypothetical protein